MDVFVGDTYGPEEYACFFAATDGNDESPPGGYLYVSDQKADRIVRHLGIFSNPKLGVEEKDIRILWSSDETKCGVAIWGRMRGVIDLVSGNELAVPLEGPESPAVTDPAWLQGFTTYLDENDFIRARQRYWKQIVKEHEVTSHPLPEDQTPIETNFILYENGAYQFFAVFEDDGETGYLYIYDAERHKAMRHLHVYDRSEELRVRMEDVQVMWSDNGSKCGVVIWSKMRGIIDLKKEQPGRVWMKTRETPGIADREWLSGFSDMMDH